jgi:predicted transcriptional regulator
VHRVIRVRLAGRGRFSIDHLRASERDRGTNPLDGSPSSSYSDVLEVHLTPEIQAKLAHLAAQQDRDMEAIAQEAIERVVDYDGWFIREVEKGLASADRGDLLTHEEVGARLERLLAEKQALR